MKKLILISTLLLLATISKAQLFNNVNSELCYQLYELGDPLSKYRVYIVLDEETLSEKDHKIIDQWESLDYDTRSKVTQRWGMEGKRIEAERFPYISYPPVFKKKIVTLDQLKKTDQKVHFEGSPWEEYKQYWKKSNTPF